MRQVQKQVIREKLLISSLKDFNEAWHKGLFCCEVVAELVDASE